MENNNRVCCLYRVSTGKQVDIDENNNADIPVQRKACHRFAEEQGWTITHEEQEDGVSGYKVRAADRDKIQSIKEMAIQKKFDILLVFMFDRLGRIADETPFVLEWFVKHGIRVWSVKEGEQRFEQHTDKLTNYIRFWMADGESEKTSMRTKIALGQLVEEGHFKGGLAPFGYDLVPSGRFNKKKHELLMLKVNESEAAMVRLVFNKYTNEGYGDQRLATYLNNQGYRTRTGENWHHASIGGMLRNLTYTGVLRSGESRSEVIPELQIISPEQYQWAKEIRAARANKAAETRTIPLNTRGESLLAGNVFCAHCGARLTITTSGKGRVRPDGGIDNTKRLRYVCYGKTRKRTSCDGQTGYTMHILDGIIDNMVRGIFEKMEKIPKSELVAARYEKELSEQKTRLAETKSSYAKETNELAVLKKEVVNAILGKSQFSTEILSGLIDEKQAECDRLKNLCEKLEDKISDSRQKIEELSKSYDRLISWADLYDSASMEAKKMIVSNLIDRVEVGRDYKLNIKFNISVSQFLFGLDERGTAEPA